LVSFRQPITPRTPLFPYTTLFRSITDGRAFLEQTDRTYDLILYALPDSLTLVSGASSLRLESYLFTEEAMRAARERLKPGGAFRSEEHTSELQSRENLVCRLLLEK